MRYLERHRLDIDQICALWQRIPGLWGNATDEERTQLLQALVIRVEMVDNEKGACKIALAPQAPVHKLELNSDMGAGTRLIANYYARIIIEVPMLRPTPVRRRALYTTWPEEGCAGQRPFRLGENHGTVVAFAGK